MSDIPEVMLARRREVSGRFLSGDGIEIGALHHPLWVDRARARVEKWLAVGVVTSRGQPFSFAPG